MTTEFIINQAESTLIEIIRDQQEVIILLLEGNIKGRRIDKELGKEMMEIALRNRQKVTAYLDLIAQ